jgi:hypothetical protein
MNSKSVLGRIAKLLSLSEEVNLTYAKLADGTIVESATFDVGEDLFVVSEDGTKTPAPDGFHDLMLKDEEGNENLIKVKSEGGKIVERENVELADVEDKKTEPLAGDPTAVNDVKDEKAAGEAVEDLKPASMLAEETVDVEPIAQDADKGDMVDEEAEEEGGDLVIALKKSLDKLAYRIEEMEKKFADMEKVKEEVVDKEADEEVELGEEELPKLDGAPVDEATKFSTETSKKTYGKKEMSAQASFLSKLYK